jgi:hypothetical protein
MEKAQKAAEDRCEDKKGNCKVGKPPRGKK